MMTRSRGITSEKIKSELGWTPQFGLDDMTLSAWKWQQQLEKK